VDSRLYLPGLLEDGFVDRGKSEEKGGGFVAHGLSRRSWLFAKGGGGGVVGEVSGDAKEAQSGGVQKSARCRCPVPGGEGARVPADPLSWEKLNAVRGRGVVAALRVLY